MFYYLIVFCHFCRENGEDYCPFLNPTQMKVWRMIRDNGGMFSHTSILNVVSNLMFLLTKLASSYTGSFF